jgi:hypothetical protein
MPVSNGKITKLITQDSSGQDYGPLGYGGKTIKAEVYVQLSYMNERDYFGLQLSLKSGSPNLPSRLAMLSLLRDAYIHDRQVVLQWTQGEFLIHRVQI